MRGDADSTGYPHRRFFFYEAAFGKTQKPMLLIVTL
jgi:hypothetical protein